MKNICKLFIFQHFYTGNIIILTGNLMAAAVFHHLRNVTVMMSTLLVIASKARNTNYSNYKNKDRLM